MYCVPSQLDLPHHSATMLATEGVRSPAALPRTENSREGKQQGYPIAFPPVYGFEIRLLSRSTCKAMYLKYLTYLYLPTLPWVAVQMFGVLDRKCLLDLFIPKTSVTYSTISTYPSSYSSSPQYRDLPQAQHSCSLPVAY